MNRALFIGRFQPYHLGHHEAVKKILKENDELIIAVGSAQDSLLPSSPFTCGERIEMIHLALKEEKCHDKCFLIGVPDVNEHPIWAARVIEYIPKFETLYTNNPLTKFWDVFNYSCSPDWMLIHVRHKKSIYHGI